MPVKEADKRLGGKRESFRMGRFSLRFLLTSVLLGVAGGFGLAFASLSLANRFAGDTRPVLPAGRFAAAVPMPAAGASVATACRATQNSHLAVTAPSQSLNDLWNRLLASTTEPTMDDFNAAQQQWRKLAASDLRVRQDLMHRYEVSDERGRKAAVFVFSQLRKPDVIDFATRLTAATDASQRRDGFELLGGFEMFRALPDGKSDEIHVLVSHALETEQDPTVLSQAIRALGPPGDARPAETQATLQQLGTLAQNSDADVRAQSLKAIVRWDKTGQVAEGAVYKALSDAQPDVRAAALSEINDNPLRSDRIKSALLGMIGNVNESADVKADALNVLQLFPLSQEEYASYHQAREQLASSGETEGSDSGSAD
jgi:hypothetical protein